jgi:quercetin dioxygenase-like cupin family protein
MTRYKAAWPAAARLVSATLVCATLVSVTLLSVTWACAQQPGIQRKTLLQHDGAPGYQTIVNIIEFAPGAHEIRHTHPGTLSGYVLEGTLTLEHEGRPTATYKAGEAFYVEAGKVHAGSNATAVPLEMIATLVVEAGKPPSSPAP